MTLTDPVEGLVAALEPFAAIAMPEGHDRLKDREFVMSRIWTYGECRKASEALAAYRAAPKPVIDEAAFMHYDAGLLSGYGGGDVSWWQDYIRAEIGRANDHWASQLQAALTEPNDDH